MIRRYSLFGLAAAACFAETVASYSDPKAPAIHRVCVVPAEARLTRVGMKGGESLTKESDEWAVKLGAALERAITDAGGELKGGLSLDALATNEDARQAVLRLRQEYKNVSAQMRKKRNDVRKGRYTLGDEISLLPCAGEADSIAFVDASGLVQTGGRKTLSILTGGVLGAFCAMSRYEIWLAFANAKTGEITTLLRLNSLGGKTGSNPDDALNRTLVSEFKKLHFNATF
jgi:hypothetical protein